MSIKFNKSYIFANGGKRAQEQVAADSSNDMPDGCCDANGVPENDCNEGSSLRETGSFKSICRSSSGNIGESPDDAQTPLKKRWKAGNTDEESSKNSPRDGDACGSAEGVGSKSSASSITGSINQSGSVSKPHCPNEFQGVNLGDICRRPKPYRASVRGLDCSNTSTVSALETRNFGVMKSLDGGSQGSENSNIYSASGEKSAQSLSGKRKGVDDEDGQREVKSRKRPMVRLLVKRTNARSLLFSLPDHQQAHKSDGAGECASKCPLTKSLRRVNSDSWLDKEDRPGGDASERSRLQRVDSVGDVHGGRLRGRSDESLQKLKSTVDDDAEDCDVASPRFVLSSGRVPGRASNNSDSSRGLTIDGEFEQYFSKLLL